MIASVNASDINETDDNESYLESPHDDSILELNESNTFSDKGFDVKTPEEAIITSVYLDVKMPKYVKNNLTVYVDDIDFKNISSKEVYDNFGDIDLDLSNFSLGMHNLVFKYNDENYSFTKQTSINLTLFKAYIPTSIRIDDDTDDMGPSIDFKGIEEFEGMEATIYIDGKKVGTHEYSDYDIEGYYVGNLAIGNHEIRVTFRNGSYFYSKTVTANTYYGFSVSANLIYGKKQSIKIYFPKDLGKSKLTVKIDGKKYKYARYDDYLKIADPNLSIGTHKLTISYAGDKTYPAETYSKNIKVTGEIDMPYDNYYVTSADKISLNLPKNAKGKLHVDISTFNGDSFEKYDILEIPLVDGKATYSFKKLPANEEFYIDCFYTGNDYTVSSKAGCYKIIKPKLSGTKDIKMSYYDGTSFKVKVCDSLDNILKYKYVSIKIDGKEVKKIITDENGVATYKITQTPKKYKITAQVGNVKVTKKLTVKQILSLKKVKVRKTPKN